MAYYTLLTPEEQIHDIKEVILSMEYVFEVYKGDIDKQLSAYFETLYFEVNKPLNDSTIDWSYQLNNFGRTKNIAFRYYEGLIRTCNRLSKLRWTTSTIQKILVMNLIKEELNNTIEMINNGSFDSFVTLGGQFNENNF